MAHGSPRVKICNNCNMYGLISRFSKSKCPNRNKATESIDRDTLKRRLRILIHRPLLISFEWRKIK